jgi:hypothetical protein
MPAITVRPGRGRISACVCTRTGTLVADQEDVRRIALALPATSEADDRFSFSVQNRSKQRAFVWAWSERIEPGKRRVARRDVIAVRVVDRLDKEALLVSGRPAFFTEPHYDGFPAILVRLPLIEVAELEELILDAWRCQAPAALRAAVEAKQAEGRDERNPVPPGIAGAG